MYCPNCNAPIKEGARFCDNCGTALSAPQYSANPDPSVIGIPYLPQGYSSRVNDPEILAAVKKNRKAAKIFAVILVPLPLIVMLIYSLVSDRMETGQALGGGAFVSLVFLIFAVRSFIKERASNSYDAVVTEKKTRRRSDNDENDVHYYTEYITIAQTTDGKKKKIVEREGSMVLAYNYLQVGDRFMYHPQFHFPYELYDKSKAPFIACVSCGTHNPVQADRCSKCNLPLLK